MDAYQRFPKKWKTLGVRWPKRHGVTAPLVTDVAQKGVLGAYLLITLTFSCQHDQLVGV